MLPRGLKELTGKGVSAAKEELEQMHSCGCFRAIVVKELMRQDKVRAQEGLMILSQKRCVHIKGRIAYNGKAIAIGYQKKIKAHIRSSPRL